MPRFVILWHQTPPNYQRPAHFDLMLEHNGSLRTWALDKLPETGETVSAEQLPDHRLAYLTYEGEVTGGRGNVSRVDSGSYEVNAETPGELAIHLTGSQLRGTVRLSRDATSGHRWLVWLVGD